MNQRFWLLNTQLLTELGNASLKQMRGKKKDEGDVLVGRDGCVPYQVSPLYLSSLGWDFFHLLEEKLLQKMSGVLNAACAACRACPLPLQASLDSRVGRKPLVLPAGSVPAMLC